MSDAMALDAARIERYSRQIILPQVGGAGQLRLLRAAVAVAGDGEAAATLAAYLVGAGVGHLHWHGAAPDAARIAAINPDVTIARATGSLGTAGGDVLAGCDMPLAEVDGAARTRRPLVVGGVAGPVGWVAVSAASTPCAGCAARAARAALPPPAHDASEALTPATAGVVGSLLALEILKLLLGQGSPPAGWWRFDGTAARLEPHPVAPAADCQACAAP